MALRALLALLVLTSCTATVRSEPCDDSNPCTTDLWSGSGCEHKAVAGGTACEADGCVGRCYPPLVGVDGGVLEAGECDCLGR